MNAFRVTLLRDLVTKRMKDHYSYYTAKDNPHIFPDNDYVELVVDRRVKAVGREGGKP